MDQVLGYMRRQLFSSRPESSVTAAMVNNYIRDGILPRTKGKKYSREHIAKLTAVCIMKQVLSVGDISSLFSLVPPEDIQRLYEKYRETLDEELSSVIERVPDGGDGLVLGEAVVRFALASYANKVAAEHLIDIIEAQEEEERGRDGKGKGK
ncbi:MAG: DUF1836 domain-containing protein [Firmicutes bacterium]|nr:DUF1836 domain-containing protein [Bacillota bacterium]